VTGLERIRKLIADHDAQDPLRRDPYRTVAIEDLREIIDALDASRRNELAALRTLRDRDDENTRDRKLARELGDRHAELRARQPTTHLERCDLVRGPGFSECTRPARHEGDHDWSTPTPPSATTLLYRGSGADLATDLIALIEAIDTIERDRFFDAFWEVTS
jgi:hypothetical protein